MLMKSQITNTPGNFATLSNVYQANPNSALIPYIPAVLQALHLLYVELHHLAKLLSRIAGGTVPALVLCLFRIQIHSS
jgi:hypothetical protein